MQQVTRVLENGIPSEKIPLPPQKRPTQQRNRHFQTWVSEPENNEGTMQQVNRVSENGTPSKKIALPLKKKGPCNNATGIFEHGSLSLKILRVRCNRKTEPPKKNRLTP